MAEGSAVQSRYITPMKKIIAAIVLAAMIAPARADDSYFPKGLFEFLDMLNRSWLATAFANYDPSGWNGVWPNSRMVLHFEPGGVIKEHIERWQELARSGADVEILGPCFSACTMIVAYVPKERLCFGVFASLQFHLAREPDTGKMSLGASLWMLHQYPRDIYDWLMEMGGVASMTIRDFWELRAPTLWQMGYRKCERDR
jgi:hypothetical protein